MFKTKRRFVGTIISLQACSDPKKKSYRCIGAVDIYANVCVRLVESFREGR